MWIEYRRTARPHLPYADDLYVPYNYIYAKNINAVIDCFGGNPLLAFCPCCPDPNWTSKTADTLQNVSRLHRGCVKIGPASAHLILSSSARVEWGRKKTRFFEKFEQPPHDWRFADRNPGARVTPLRHRQYFEYWVPPNAIKGMHSTLVIE